jgi:hypothetical protein
MEKVWKDHISPDGEIRYKVSNYGDVLSLSTGKEMKIKTNNVGYKRVGLSLGTKQTYERWFVHRLVATLFIPNNNPLKTDVNHKDGNKLNNFVGNLEWVTKAENQEHAIKNSLLNPTISKQCLEKSIETTSKKVEKINIKTEEVMAVYNSIHEAARDNNIKTPSNIIGVIKGVRNSCGGYKWRYLK